MNDVIVVNPDEDEEKILDVTIAMAVKFQDHFPESKVYVVNDIDGEDHVYAQDEHGKPMFDLLTSMARKFVFLWYYIHPRKGYEMVDQMRQLALLYDVDYVVKYPNIPVKPGFPTIVRYGKHPAGNPVKLKEFIVKLGNPQLEEKIYDAETLSTYRNYDWHQDKKNLTRIRKKAISMMEEFLHKKNPKKIANVRGYVLYAGCAYHWYNPGLGFGMRDIDVNAFFSPKWYTNSRCAFTRHCEIEQLGRSPYFAGGTRWLDLMWNTFHKETGNFAKDVCNYMQEMRMKSDRWATMSQRPMIDLATKKVIYVPTWLKKMEQQKSKENQS